MATGLSPREFGGVLAELYRAATGVPRRFHLRSEDLKTIARRERARGEFFWEVARELEIMHSILMSYPRLSRGGVLGFASIRVAERWQKLRTQVFGIYCGSGQTVTGLTWLETACASCTC
jgi:hypothetical protein